MGHDSCRAARFETGNCSKEIKAFNLLVFSPRERDELSDSDMPDYSTDRLGGHQAASNKNTVNQDITTVSRGYVFEYNIPFIEICYSKALNSSCKAQTCGV